MTISHIHPKVLEEERCGDKRTLECVSEIANSLSLPSICRHGKEGDRWFMV